MWINKVKGGRAEKKTKTVIHPHPDGRLNVGVGLEVWALDCGI